MNKIVEYRCQRCEVQGKGSECWNCGLTDQLVELVLLWPGLPTPGKHPTPFWLTIEELIA